jgi:hypothetical protein
METWVEEASMNLLVEEQYRVEEEFSDIVKTARVITITREYGSGGATIGQELATRLGWKHLDRELILELARRAHVQPSAVSQMDERSPSFIERLLEACWRSDVQAWSGPVPEFVNPDILAALSAVIIREAAKLGQCVDGDVRRNKYGHFFIPA